MGSLKKSGFDVISPLFEEKKKMSAHVLIEGPECWECMLDRQTLSDACVIAREHVKKHCLSHGCLQMVSMFGCAIFSCGKSEY